MIMPAADYGLEQEQYEEYQETFDLMDKNNTGKLAPYELGILMRSLAHDPTDDELNTIIQEYNCYVNDGIEKKDFLKVMGEREQDSALKTALKKKFRVFDRDGNGYLSYDNLKDKMTTTGDNPFTLQDFDDFMAEANADGIITADGRIEYEALVDIMTRSDKVKK